jgi:hypothetical protein
LLIGQDDRFKTVSPKETRGLIVLVEPAGECLLNVAHEFTHVVEPVVEFAPVFVRPVFTPCVVIRVEDDSSGL